MQNNKTLQVARSNKNDEFYTTYETIEKELQHYKKHFKDKIVLCNCDNPYKSNFTQYFLDNFSSLQLKRLICTSLNEPNGLLLDVCDNSKLAIKMLQENGSFTSEECLEYLRISDIVVTNPPFSLFREYIDLLEEYNKKYLIIANQNALTYKNVFPLIKNNKIWSGVNYGEMSFIVPSDTEPRKTRFWIDNEGKKWRSMGNAMWLTNLDNLSRHTFLELTKTYNESDYQIYDTYNAIHINTLKDIPKDYDGIMGVPITIINKYNPEQFEIIGEANHGSDNEYDLFKPMVNGKAVFKRILIKHKGDSNNEIME